jgi:hypothetical protein
MKRVTGANNTWVTLKESQSFDLNHAGNKTNAGLLWILVCGIIISMEQSRY